jgi:hypothetical protein
MTEGNLPPQRRRGAEKTLSFLRGRCGVCIWGCAVIGVCLYKDAEAAETLARWRVAEDVMENPLRIPQRFCVSERGPRGGMWGEL